MAKTYEQIFALVDKFSAPLLKMEERMRAAGHTGEAMNRAIRPHEKLFLHINQDIETFTRKVRVASQTTREFGGRISEVLAPLAAFGAIGSVGGLVEMVHGFAEMSEQLGLASQKIGIAVGQFQALSYAAKITGINTDSMQTSLEHLNKNLGAAATGHSKEVTALLDHLHISLRGAHGQILSASQALPQLADAFAKTKDPAMQALMATTLFGRAGIDLLPLLDKGAAGVAALTAQFNKYGYALSSQDVDAGEKFNDSWKDMQTAIGGLTDDISAKLAPVLTPIIQSIADWTAANRDWIASNIASTIKSIGDSLRGIDFKSVIGDADRFMGKIGDVVSELGGLKTILLGTALVMAGPFIAPLLTIGTTAMKLVGVLGGVVGQVYGLGAAFVELLPAMTGVRDVMAAISIAADANPLGALVVAATALVAAGVLVYEEWDKVKKLFDGINSDGSGPTTDGAGHRGVRTRFGFMELPGAAGAAGGGGAATTHTVTINIPNMPAGTTATVNSPPGSPVRIRARLGDSRMLGR